ncbi:MAG: FtsW/RodA/SpoVE family cell cycle protein [Pyrinomonadaceae bacterium]|nr:FtsW/RodA/SpoVE family cell cycle protein [Pyrinomonadaceae bacterium]MCX7639866.1 FtsW/RodA/SpoVE family cell cycle protein [Pyrinomonadaceae bacterium]MDW8304038.1 FtsW/RodA/SpoVE family cell cycle protein [Acidobacteriota bacterium]
MKLKTTTHVLILLILVLLTAIAHYSIYYSALIRGYETSWLTASRNLFLLFVLAILPIFLSALLKYKGEWTIYTAAVILFSIGLTIQYRLFSDPEYISRDKRAEARQQKIKTLQERYIQENYTPEKKQIAGFPPTPAQPADLSKETPRPAPEKISDVLTSGKTWIPLFGILMLIASFLLMTQDKFLKLLQNNGFLIVVGTLIPLTVAAITSQAGKFIGNMTPWEPSKVPFLIGFAAVLSELYRRLMKTYWGIPRAQDLIPLVFMAVLPFVPFFVLKDFGQMLVFSSVYITLYLIAVRRMLQRLVFAGSVAFLATVLILSALPQTVQVKIPILSTLSEPIKKILPPRIHQRFHLWFDAFTPPSPDTAWWKDDLAEFYWKNYRSDLIERKPEAEQLYNELDRISSQPNQTSETKAKSSQIRSELRRIALEDILQIHQLTKDLDNSEMSENREEERNLRELKARLDSINEEAWFSDDALQASRATFGIFSGGKTGRGLGLGYVELIPVADSDYIYAAIGEELGLFGGFLVIFALIIFVIVGIKIAIASRDMFGKLCATGLTAFIGFQALVNIGGITRALPMTGITLPFVSHGGFSLITSFIMLGMLMAISHRNAVDFQNDNLIGRR